MGLLSDAGYPTILDPAAPIVRQAHREDFRVRPLVGPSSVTLALAASGLNGQRFLVAGYPPRQRHQLRRWIQQYERLSYQHQQTIVFIETPYRTQQTMQTLVHTLRPTTLLCIAQALTSPNEWIYTAPVVWWQRHTDQVLNEPTVFLFQA